MKTQIRPTLHHCPAVLVVAGHDPAGAGIQADIETIAALGCRAATLITCLTTQSSRGVRSVYPTPGYLLLEQAACLLSDIAPPMACKIGLIPNEDSLDAVLEILNLLPAGTPVIVDPVLGATGGGRLSESSMPGSLATRLLPRATLATPNTGEFRRLTGMASDPDVITQIASEWCLIKAADEPGDTIVHRLYQHGCLFAAYHWPKIEGVFHGSGCTLASAISAFIARGESLATAVAHGLDYTWRALAMSPIDPGGVQLLPGRPQA